MIAWRLRETAKTQPSHRHPCPTAKQTSTRLHPQHVAHPARQRKSRPQTREKSAPRAAQSPTPTISTGSFHPDHAHSPANKVFSESLKNPPEPRQRATLSGPVHTSAASNSEVHRRLTLAGRYRRLNSQNHVGRFGVRPFPENKRLCRTDLKPPGLHLGGRLRLADKKRIHNPPPAKQNRFKNFSFRRQKTICTISGCRPTEERRTNSTTRNRPARPLREIWEPTITCDLHRGSSHTAAEILTNGLLPKFDQFLIWSLPQFPNTEAYESRLTRNRIP